MREGNLHLFFLFQGGDKMVNGLRLYSEHYEHPKGYKPPLESVYQKRLISKIEKRFPGCIVIKQDPTYIQGIPDLIILYNDRWATLECKRSFDAPHQPNQDYWVNRQNQMSFSAFIFPENEEVILNELQKSFESSRRTRFSRSK